MSDLEIMASALFRMIHGKSWRFSTGADRSNYLAICRQTIEQVKAEQAQQPQGQKEVA